MCQTMTTNNKLVRMHSDKKALEEGIKQKRQVVCLITCALDAGFGISSAKTPDKQATCFFYSVSEPNITVQAYFQRVARYSKLSPEACVIAMVYLARIKETVPVDKRTMHRLLLTALVLASKFWDDGRIRNRDWAEIGGLRSEELLSLEGQFLKQLKFDLFVSTSDFREMVADLHRAAGFESFRFYSPTKVEEENGHEKEKGNKQQQQQQCLTASPSNLPA